MKKKIKKRFWVKFEAPHNKRNRNHLSQGAASFEFWDFFFFRKKIDKNFRDIFQKFLIQRNLKRKNSQKSQKIFFQKF